MRCSINFLRCNELMDESMTLAEAGIRDGDQVQLVRSPLRCLTASLDGTVRLWHLHSKATDEANPFMSFREEEALDSHGPVLSASLALGAQCDINLHSITRYLIYIHIYMVYIVI